MGSGKSTAGKKLAAIMGWDFIDLDELIEQTYSKSIAEIFMLSGETVFRKYESELLRDMNILADTVVSVGGGAPCFSGNMEYMKKNGKVIYLKMTPKELKERLMEDKKPRPLLKGLQGDELEKFIELRLIDRESFYMQANLVENGNDPDFGLLAEKTLQMFRGRGN
jgi:shikimate kinase